MKHRRVNWQKESRETNEHLAIKSRYARGWKWIPGQNGAVKTRVLTEAERKDMGLD